MGANTSGTEENTSNKSSSNAPKSGDASGASSSASGPSNALVKHAKDAVSHVADQAISQAKEKVGNQVTEQTKRSVVEIGNVAKALKNTSEELGDNLASPLVGRAAEGLQKASDFLQDATLDDIVGSVQSFAKREPVLFLGGAFAIGMLGARFLKSSSHHQVTGAMKTSAQSRGRVGTNHQGARSQSHSQTGLSNLASGSIGSPSRS